MRNVKAAEIMSTPVYVVRARDAIPDVVRTLRRHGISGAPVVDEFGLLFGVVSEGDILEKEAGPGGAPELGSAMRHAVVERSDRPGHFTAEQVMSRPVVTATEDATVAEVTALMLRNGVNRIPIVRGEDLVGIVTRSDVLSLFDRPARSLLQEARKVLGEDLLLDLSRLDVLVVDGMVKVVGQVSAARDVHLIETLLARMDGVTDVDISALTVSRAATA